VFLKLRGIVRAQAFSTSVAAAAKERDEKYEHKLARQMLLYPIAYTILILPIACCRFSEWTGHSVPFAATIFSDFIYLLSGLVHVILFVCSRRILPPRSVLPKFLISKPSVLLASTTLPDDDFDSYYNDAGSVRPWYPPTPPKGKSSTTITEARDPFSDLEKHQNGDSEAAIRRVHSPDSERSSSRRSLSVEGDHAELREVSLSPGTSQWPFEAGEFEGDELADAPTHREGERMALPHTPPSAHRHH